MHYWNLLRDWTNLESVRTVHSYLEGWALVFFALLVLFDVLAHLTEDEHPERAKRFESIGLWCFGVAVFAEVLAYPYSQRNDKLASSLDADQRAKIATLDNSTQRLKTEAQYSKERADRLETGLETERQKTAHFQKEADVARLALEKQLRTQGPRWALLEASKNAFIKSLKPFSGQRITVVECGTWGRVDPEPFRLEQDILNFIGKEGAGWVVGYKSWESCPAGGATSSGGNLITFNSTARGDVKNAAKELYDVLNKLTISTVMFQAQSNAVVTLELLGANSPQTMAVNEPTTIFFLVGPNPMFDIAGTGKAKSKSKAMR